MPIINIEEREETALTSFDAGENVVLIPLVVRGSHKVAEFSDAYAFRTAYNDYRFTFDKTYAMAYQLLLQGMKVVIKPIEGKAEDIQSEDDVEEAILTAIDGGAYEEFYSKNIYNIKFITTGAYANSTIADTLLKLAAGRGDAIALIELNKSLDRAGIIEAASALNYGEQAKFAACTYPWANYTLAVKNDSSSYSYIMPGCFAYLMAYSNSVQSNANWFAAAGVVRGEIPCLDKSGILVDVDEALMHFLQGDTSMPGEGTTTLSVKNPINVIYNAGVYGYVLWGNKVFYKKTASSVTSAMYQDFLNVRVLVCDIKKQVYHAAMRTTFEPNDDIVWLNFKSLANTLLDRMKSGRGVKWYKWVKLKGDPTTGKSEKGVIYAQLVIQPIEAVESFNIYLNLTDEDASVTE